MLCRGLLGYAFAFGLVFLAVFMVLNKYLSGGKSIHEVKVVAPPVMNTMEQLLAVQNAISQAEGFIQDTNIVLLKLRGLMMSIYPQVTRTKTESVLFSFPILYSLVFEILYSHCLLLVLIRQVRNFQ